MTASVPSAPPQKLEDAWLRAMPGRYTPFWDIARDALRALKDAGLPRAILTNGNCDMIDVSVRSAGMDGLLDHVGTLLSDVVAVATRRA